MSTNEGGDDLLVIGVGEVHIGHPLLFEFRERIVAFAAGFAHHFAGNVEGGQSQLVVSNRLEDRAIGIEIVSPGVLPIA